ncbi:MAG: Asp-tRNA(Asn)/Glu-tRNA(Gln) amidotransferase subunit GatB, partial [Pseudomonadota bacterium]|nr:Asp-tRNA(Asn)/Glu-tRNA(Gln) amidotransferase subunit GatB [Pseudomonadota bacterium]
MSWETVIGLEVHVQLSTNTKIFSSASTEFGNEQNSQANEIDLALPGTLPVLNKAALEYAIMFGLAIDAEINNESVFERKNYFYPDLPKGYQTTQLEKPIVGKGSVPITLSDGVIKNIGIHHAHLEEDAGKSLHSESHRDGYSLVDLNRAGTPLIEIVSEPDMRSAAEAVAFAKKLHSIVTAIGICDGDMSQGSMRFDVNISVRPAGSSEFGTRTETKNLNSFKFMEDAINLEVNRQIRVLEDGGKIMQETRLYNGVTKKSQSMRSKEEANDYRYFPCPDLLPVHVSKEFIDNLRKDLPELPENKKNRYKEQYGLSEYDANGLTENFLFAKFFEDSMQLFDKPKLLANWILGDVSSKLNQANITLKDSLISPKHLVELLKRIEDKTISNKIAKEVFEEIFEGKGNA